MQRYQIGNTRYYIVPIDTGFEIHKSRETKEGTTYNFYWHFFTIEGMLKSLPNLLLAEQAYERNPRSKVDITKLSAEHQSVLTRLTQYQEKIRPALEAYHRSIINSRPMDR